MADHPSRFVILEHDWDGVHYDLMLERDGVLKTWRLARPLIKGEQEALELADHRLDYLTYEGPVSGGRGTVKRIEKGTYLSHTADVDGHRILLVGQAVRGELSLTKVDGQRWMITFKADSNRP